MTNEGSGQSSESNAERQRDEVDTLLDVLSDPYRRHVLYYLRDRGNVSVAELVTVLTGWLHARESERQISTPEIATPEYRREVAISLHHRHLPKLAECGFVGYDSDTKTIGLESVPESLAAYLDLSLEIEREENESAQTAERSLHDESG
ncbi:DUF7344 domain-containing protein [Halorussus halophilus]|uniref:DUF7344 domain-containing protein n=1 Tax=Halorussus halophilus TaxID=2650975 RepID=UPI00130113D8|nr:hypothetical protein [Halorussus halophilus]